MEAGKFYARRLSTHENQLHNRGAEPCKSNGFSSIFIVPWGSLKVFVILAKDLWTWEFRLVCWMTWKMSQILCRLSISGSLFSWSLSADLLFAQSKGVLPATLELTQTGIGASQTKKTYPLLIPNVSAFFCCILKIKTNVHCNTLALGTQCKCTLQTMMYHLCRQLLLSLGWFNFSALVSGIFGFSLICR